MNHFYKLFFIYLLLNIGINFSLISYVDNLDIVTIGYIYIFNIIYGYHLINILSYENGFFIKVRQLIVLK